MAGQGDNYKTCELCGATIYPEHIQRGAADYWAGKLLCAFCLDDKRGSATGLQEEAAPGAGGAGDPPVVSLEPATAKAAGAPRIQAFGQAGLRAGQTGTLQFRRPLLTDSPHATRCRTFHCKLNDASMAHMNTLINEWVDEHDDICIKFATSSVGVVEGKSSSDPNLFVTVFY